MNFQRFLSQKYPDFNLETILKPLAADENIRYELLDSLISYLQVSGLTPSSINFYMASVRSYFAYNDIDIIPSKFKRKLFYFALYVSPLSFHLRYI
jgi:hypothetical protein